MRDRGSRSISGVPVLAAAAAALMFLPAPGAGQDTLVARVTEGRAAFVEICGACHGIDKPEKKNMGRPAWDELITSMEAKGAQLTAEERELILDYLGIRNVFLTKCSSCHTVDRILARNQPYGEWEKTVGRMVEKGPGLLAEGEARSITAYLAAIRGLEPAAK